MPGTAAVPNVAGMEQTQQRPPALADSVAVRPFCAGQVGAVVELLQLTSARDVRSVAARRLLDPDPARPQDAVVAVSDGAVVGAGAWWADRVYPGTARVALGVSPDQRGRGIGSALARVLLSSAADRAGDLVLHTELRDDRPRGLRFAVHQGFEEVHHSLGWRLPVTGAQPELAARAARTATDAGVRVRPAMLDVERATVVGVATASMQGLPTPFPPDLTQVPQLLPAGTVALLATDLDREPGRVVGLTLLREQAPERWYTPLTAVLPAARGRGVATALKAATLLAAARAGILVVGTHTSDTNTAMVRANRAAGALPDTGYRVLARPHRRV